MLDKNLLLVSFLTDLLGNDAEDLRNSMRGADEGRRSDGQSFYYSVLESRSALRVSTKLLAKFDLNILKHESQLAKSRPEFRLKYFQYLAALYTELYLHLLKTDKIKLSLDLEAYRRAHFSDLPASNPNDLYKLSLWMATGAGKTLLMHLNVLQFQHYGLFETNNILLVTPTDTLTKQHLKDFAESGVPAHYFKDAAPLNTPAVKVIEITKLLPEGEKRSGGLSVPVTNFEGPNLVLVDEGHKGTSSKSDREDERKWRNVREALVSGVSSERGFTFEYSATFAQVTEGSADVAKTLFNEYARSIVFDYPYAKFHADGYGKDFAIMNLKQEDELFGDALLLGALLTYYEQFRYVKDHPEVAREYELQTPLMVFVGAYVNAGNEVLDVLVFLDRVLREGAWVRETSENFLSGDSGLPAPDGVDAFATSFPYLKTLGPSSDQLYRDLCQDLFYGDGGLGLFDIKNADGEVGLRAFNSDTYCGLVYVGDSKTFIKKVESDSRLRVGEDENLSGALFPSVSRADSRINFLVGSKKFTEGWSSWRVSTMGLIKVGSNAGAQVLQLFGRGVRLQGKGLSLRRSEALQGETPPEHLALAETLGIFGLNANYLKRFLDMLKIEGLEAPVNRILDIKINTDLLRAGLTGITLNPEYDFTRETRTFKAEAINDVSVSVGAAVETGTIEGIISATTKDRELGLSDRVFEMLPFEELYQHGLDFKARKGWQNLFVSREELKGLLRDKFKLAAPEAIHEPKTYTHYTRLVAAAKSAIEDGLGSYYLSEQRRAESKELRRVTIDAAHANFPRVEDRPAYTLKVPVSLLEEVEALLADSEALQKATDREPLPRMYVTEHLYDPLLVKSKRGTLGVKSTPTGLEPSEVDFIQDLRRFWSGNSSTPDWKDYSIYLMRNLPKKGIGFFQTAGFYPDFLLWLKRKDEQALAFVEPHGLVQWEEDKVALLTQIPTICARLNLPVEAFIVTPTTLEKIPIQNVAIKDKVAHLESRHVFLQSDSWYIQKIMEKLKESLGTVVA